MEDKDLEIIRLKGELLLPDTEKEYFFRALDFWRSLYLSEHPEIDNWEKVEEIERNI